MSLVPSLRRSLLMLCTPLIAAISFVPPSTAATPAGPEVGQPGKDAPWARTSHEVVEKMMELARVAPGDYLIDLGSGDGRTVIAAAKRGARARGVEYDRGLVALSRRLAAEAGVAGRASFVRGDIFKTDFSRATVVTLFMGKDVNLKLRPKILRMKPGTRVVSNTFSMEEWESDGMLNTEGGDLFSSWRTALLWIVPARVEGRWQLDHATLTLKQTFQKLSGALASAAGSVPIMNGKLHGDQIMFTAGGDRYSGRVSAKTMEGTHESGNGSSAWKATRASR